MAELESAWRAFARDGGPSTEILLELSGPPAYEPEPLLPRVQRRTDGGLELCGDGFRAELSADRRRCRIVQPSARFATEAVVRMLLADAVFRKGGLLVHGR